MAAEFDPLIRTVPAAVAMSIPAGYKLNDSRRRVAVGHCGYDYNPCNMHLEDLAKEVVRYMPEELAGLTCSVSGVSDGISMGTEGMKSSLPSRDAIADAFELHLRSITSDDLGGIRYQGFIALPGCDKNMPAVIMAAARVNIPSIMVYGGTIRAGKDPKTGAVLDVINGFQLPGQLAAGKISEEDAARISCHACPGAGACGGQYTANTMASAIEALGMSLPGSSSTPAEEKDRECFNVGAAMSNLLDLGITPRDIMTREAFFNAITVVNATGGSTNAVLHLVAMAKAAGIKLTVDDFQRVSDRTPYLVNMKPSGPYVMEHLHQRGGIPALMKYLLNEDLLEGRLMTVTGKTLEQNLSDVEALKPDQDLLYALNKPLKKTGHIQILRGNLAPTSAVGKITGKEGELAIGKALMFDSEEHYTREFAAGNVIKAINENRAKGEKTAVGIRYEGPVGGPGMREMLYPTSSISGAGLQDWCFFFTDARYSGGSTGFVVGHVTPEAQLGGPIAYIRNGDPIKIDAVNRTIDHLVPEAEFEQRKEGWVAPQPKYTQGALFKYARDVTPAYEGCVTDE